MSRFVLRWEQRKIHHFFPTGIYKDEFLSEDFYFCELAKQTGYAIYVAPQIQLRHVGRTVYEGGPE